MTPDSPPPTPRPPHPLTLALIARLRRTGGGSVLEIGPGSGRNTRALEAGGLTVVGLEAPHADGALSTHALLHGTSREVAALLREIGDRLSPGAPLFATFGSVRDSRFAAGRMVEPFVYAPEGGDE